MLARLPYLQCSSAAVKGTVWLWEQPHCFSSTTAWAGGCSPVPPVWVWRFSPSFQHPPEKKNSRRPSWFCRLFHSWGTQLDELHLLFSHPTWGSPPSHTSHPNLSQRSSLLLPCILCHQAWSLLACCDKASQSPTPSWFILDAALSITVLSRRGKQETCTARIKSKCPSKSCA